MKRILGICCVSVVAVGCSAVKVVQPEYKEGYFPEVNKVTTVNVGQPMVTEYEYFSEKKAILMGNVSAGIMLARRDASKGMSLVPVTSDGIEVFCLPPGGLGSPCFRDEDNDKKFEWAYSLNGYNALIEKMQITPVPYKKMQHKLKDGFKYELLYQGLDEDVVKISYREYTENLARPAFRQEISYNLKSGGDTDIQFKDVNLTIHHADNMGVKYTVNSGFKRPEL